MLRLGVSKSAKRDVLGSGVCSKLFELDLMTVVLSGFRDFRDPRKFDTSLF